VLFFRVYTESKPRRSAAPLLSPTSIPTSMRRNSHGIISFADPHPLNSVLSYRYKNMGGRGEAISPSPCFPLPLSLLVATLMGPLVSVANKRLIEMLNPLNATLTKNRGVGVLLLTRNPKKDLYPERHSGAEGSLLVAQPFLAVRFHLSPLTKRSPRARPYPLSLRPAILEGNTMNRSYLNHCATSLAVLVCQTKAEQAAEEFSRVTDHGTRVTDNV
jgi:hypothetical protein